MERKRLFINKKTGTKERIEIIKWAANNNYDALVFPLQEKLSAGNALIKLAKRYELIIEEGGHELSLLLPRRLFLFNRDLFRMEQGKRKSRCHFCPTNPKTTAIITQRAHKLFARSLQTVTAPRIFHMFPDEGQENTWCACPACRAFSPAEQYLISVNSAADALARIDPNAQLGFFDYGAESPSAGVKPRGNMFRLKENDIKR